MTKILAEQMRQFAAKLEELAQQDMPQGELTGTLNPKQLAELLGIDDMQTFTRSINKIKMGHADKLTRMEMTELAIAFVNLLAAQPEDTTKAMTAIRRVSAKEEEPVMEADSMGKVHDIGISHLRKVIAGGKYKLGDPDVDLKDPNIMGKTLTLINPKTPEGFQKTRVRVSTDRTKHDGDFMFKS